MCKVILFGIVHAWNQIKKLFTVPWNTSYYEKLDPRGDTKYQNFDSFVEDI